MREYTATMRGADLAKLSTMIVVPNVPVMEQWMEALRQSGVGKQQASCLTSSPLFEAYSCLFLLTFPSTPPFTFTVTLTALPGVLPFTVDCTKAHLAHFLDCFSPQVLRFTGDFTKARLEAPDLRNRPLPRVVILRKHQLQSEQQGVFKHLPDKGGDEAAAAVPLGRTRVSDIAGSLAGSSSGGSGGSGAWRVRERDRQPEAAPPVVSGLTPHASGRVERELHKAYEGDKGRKVGRRKFGITDPAALCTLIATELRRLGPEQRPWLSMIIDEAHE